MEEQSGGQYGEQSHAGQTRSASGGPLAAVALAAAVLSLLLCWMPVAGLLLALTSVVLAIVARSKGSAGGAAVGALAVGAVSACIGLGSTACGLLFAKGARDLSQGLKASGVDMDGLLQGGGQQLLKAASMGLAAQDAASPAAAQNRELLIESLEAFRAKYQRAAGQEFPVDMDAIRKRVASMSELDLALLQTQLLVAQLPGQPDETVAELGEALVPLLTPEGTITIQEASDSSDSANSEDEAPPAGDEGGEPGE